MSKTDLEERALTAIGEYMVRQNRPYSQTDVFNNMHQEFGKTLIIKCLESAVAQGIVKEKLIGKQKIYYANQDKLESCDEGQLAAIDQDIAAQSKILTEKTTEMKSLQAELRCFQSSLTTDELTMKIAKLKKEMELRLTALGSAAQQVTAEEKKQVCDEQAKMGNEWRTRKRVGTVMFSSLRETCPLSSAEMMDEIGIELDP